MTSFKWAFGEYAEKLKKCPVCGSKEGFWFIMKKDKKYAQCKSCGAEFLLCVIFPLEKKEESIASLLHEKEL